jgi:hypothetical protein
VTLFVLTFYRDLGNSNVSGSIGPEISRLVNLQYLYVPPPLLMSSTYLFLLFQQNKMACDLLHWNLICRELYRNNLGGEIPKELGKLKNLISLDLYANKLTGRIPKSLSKLSSLRFMYVLYNH